MATLEDIIFPNYGKGGLGTLKCSINIKDIWPHLRAECIALYKHEPSSDVTQKEHVTYWTHPKGVVRQWSLLNREGRFDTTYCDSEPRGGSKDVPMAKVYGSISKFVDMWPEAINFRLNLLGPQSSLSPHKEQIVVKKDGQIRIKARFHLPIISNEHSRVMLSGLLYRFEPGEIYYFNNSCVHSATNDGFFDRVHLVWDCYITSRIKRILEESAPLTYIGTATVGDHPAEVPTVPEEEALLAASRIL